MKFELDMNLRRLLDELKFPLESKGPIFNFTTSPDFRSRRVNDWYTSRVAEISRREESFRRSLESAREGGLIDPSEYQRAMFELSSPFNPFHKLREEALGIRDESLYHRCLQ